MIRVARLAQGKNGTSRPFPSSHSTFLPLLPPFPSLSFEVGPLNPARAEIESGAF